MIKNMIIARSVEPEAPVKSANEKTKKEEIRLARLISMFTMRRRIKQAPPTKERCKPETAKICAIPAS